MLTRKSHEETREVLPEDVPEGEDEKDIADVAEEADKMLVEEEDESEGADEDEEEVKSLSSLTYRL